MGIVFAIFLLQVCANVNDVQVQTVPLTPDFDVVVSEVSEIVIGAPIKRKK